jgi:hypothetical protein
VAPVTKTVTYGVIETNLSGQNKCWITQNLGADNQAISASYDTEAAAGWYWQYNRKQGYKHDGSLLTPSGTWDYSINDDYDWMANEDPCTLLLGTGWRIPTGTEWTNADNNGAWGNRNDTYASVLKIHGAGCLIDGALGSLGWGFYWSLSQIGDDIGTSLNFSTTGCNVSSYLNKTYGLSIRCILNLL